MKIEKTITIIAILILFAMAFVMPASADLLWETETVDAIGNVNNPTSLAFNDTSGNPAISYLDYSIYALKYATKEGDSWTVTTIDEEGYTGYYSSLAFDGDDYPAISYKDVSNLNLKYAWQDASGWHNTSIGPTGVDPYQTSLAFNETSGNPAISYHHSTSYNTGVLNYTWNQGDVWHTETVDDSSDYVGECSSLAFNDTDYPAISYFDHTNKKLKYAWNNGETWQTITVDDATVNMGSTSLAFDQDNFPAISYCSKDTTDLKYAWQNTSGWYTATIDDGFAGQTSSLAFNTTGNPAISYRGDSHLKYAWMDSEGWHTMTADTNDNTGEYSSLVFNDGKPVISYCDDGTHHLKYAVGTVPPTTISVTSSPAGAAIYLDEVSMEEVTPFDLTTDLTAGTYNVTVILDGYEPGINNSVTVGEHEIVSVDFDLTEIPPEAPVADFTATPLTGTSPLTVQFTNTSTGVCDQWEWAFGDGVDEEYYYSDEQNPEHIYIDAGIYTVTFTAQNDGASNTITKTNLITVTDPTQAPTPAPTQVIHRGGGGGGHSEFAFSEGTGVLLTSSEGKLLRETTFTSNDSVATLTLGQNTIALGNDGKPLPKITIERINASEVPENLNGAFAFAGFAYQCTPSGATFAPGITLSFTLSDDEWNALGEGDFTIRFYDEATGEWIELPTTVNPETRTVTVEITHFSIFGLFTSAGTTTTLQSQPTVTPVPTVPTDTMTGSQDGSTPAPETTQSAPFVCVPLLALGALALLRKKL